LLRFETMAFTASSRAGKSLASELPDMEVNVRSWPSSEGRRGSESEAEAPRSTVFRSRRTTAGSFLWICELLELDPQAVRAAIHPNYNAGHNRAQEIASRVQHLKNIAIRENGLASVLVPFFLV
jgi:hypothetical protein